MNVNQNTIYMECFLDEMAHAAGRDALEFRLALMKNHPKSAAVLKAARSRVAGAATTVRPGASILHSFGSYVAACAEVSVDDDGKLSMDRIVAATDCGTAVNPQQIEAQVQGPSCTDCPVRYTANARWPTVSSKRITSTPIRR